MENQLSLLDGGAATEKRLAEKWLAWLALRDPRYAASSAVCTAWGSS